jgi:hypothetical protein
MPRKFPLMSPIRAIRSLCHNKQRIARGADITSQPALGMKTQSSASRKG